MKKITIGLFSDSFYPIADGVAKVVDNYARLLSLKANVVVFAPRVNNMPYDDTKLPYKVVRCYSIDMKIVDYSLPLPKLDRHFEKELFNYQLDIVHIHSPFTLGKIGVLYAKKKKVPCIGTMHSQYKQDFKRSVKSEYLANKLTKSIIKVFNKCDECWAVNNEIARIYYEDYHYKTMPKIMNNATEMKLVDYNEAFKYINKKYMLDKDEKIFLFVGRINILKNILFIVDTLEAIKTKRPKLKFKMIFVGDGQDMDELIKYINKKQLGKDIILTGKITDRELLANLYSRADLFLFPSKYDASSIVQIEAASQKTPGVFIEETATSSTITNNVNGFISKDTVGAYSDKIIEILENDKLLKNVSENSYFDIYKTWEQIIDIVYDRYLNLIDKNML